MSNRYNNRSKSAFAPSREKASMASSARLSARSQHRVAVENEMIKRREREFRHQETWGGQVKYYDRFEKANNKFEEWTSPRYYESNNQLVENLKKGKEKEELLQKRREKLRKLLAEEEKSYEIETMVRNRHKLFPSPRQRLDDIPTELLRELNLKNKVDEEDRRRHEAENELYRHWRSCNPTLRDYERRLKTDDLKLSWLDQQIEKRIKRENEEEECRKMLQERETRLKEEKLKEEQAKAELEEKELTYREELKRQMDEFDRRQQVSQKLQEQEEEDRKKFLQVLDLQEKQREEARRRAQCECALYNIKAHKQKLKQRAIDIQEDLRRETNLVENLLKTDAVHSVENEQKRRELQETLSQFLEFQREQQDLEKQREEYLDFVFDSEAKAMYERQTEIWEGERASRKKLLDDVLETVAGQINEKLERNKQRQREVLREREENLKVIERCDEELNRCKREAEDRRRQWMTALDVQVKEKEATRHKLKTLEQKNIDMELEKVRKEEERLRREIMELQKREKPVGPVRSRIFLG